ncbi:MAG TPA: Asp-tRNA(Asn)/Glu-tRNA(Gln) amidotransferase subunit GatC [Candidatus Woesebacteria bacterium]|jgi:aspartyl-tRNA(Asn)/glutamyl-tRNA(Gln) amidotransferase subunit C|nr:Asp-tRNA(Asn)/Glu-tRNA(Gln) amidotransferase subunit GatC [Candidatus Woesebacteria bacterium]
MSQFDSALVQHIANLANIPLKPGEDKKLAEEFESTLKVIANLKKLDTSQVKPTYQVGELENVWRDDVVEKKRMFTQEEALANATNTHKGFFAVPQIIDKG